MKSIKFNKNPVCDVYANRRSVIVTFPERIAVFDACSLEDRLLSVTTCFPSPGPNVNPVALGSRWLAYAEKKLVAWQRSSGGVGGKSIVFPALLKDVISSSRYNIFTPAFF